MIKSRLTEILSSFSENEFREFGRYVSSPYFNSNKKLISAFSYFKKFAGDLTSEKCTKENLFREIFPGKSYRDTEARKLLSGLTKLAEGFLGQKVFDADKFEQNINLSGVLITKGLLVPAEKVINELQNSAEKEKINGQHYFYDLMKIQIKKKSIELKKESFQTGDLTEDKINSYLLNYFISFSTKIIQNIRAKQYYNLIPKEHELIKFFSLLDIDSFVQWLEDTGNEYSETLIMNLCIIKCVNNEYDGPAYKRFRELLLKSLGKYSHFELNNLFTCLQGIQIRRIRENAPEALPELFEINNLILANEAFAFFPGGNMPYSTFVTMVTIGISYEKYEWVKDFISKYTPLLQEKFRQSLRNYAMAELSYAERNLEESLQYTNRIEYEGFFMKHEVNILKLKIYYDEEDYISIHYLLDTYKKLVSGSKYVGDLQFDIYSGFIKLFTELAKAKEKRDRSLAALVLKRVKEMKNIQSKEWLIEKAGELL